MGLASAWQQGPNGVDLIAGTHGEDCDQPRPALSCLPKLTAPHVPTPRLKAYLEARHRRDIYCPQGPNPDFITSEQELSATLGMPPVPMLLAAAPADSQILAVCRGCSQPNLICLH